jgi:hypothetical protein
MLLAGQQSRPATLGICTSQPRPAQPKSISQRSEVENTEPVELLWSCDPWPSDLALPALCYVGARLDKCAMQLIDFLIDSLNFWHCRMKTHACTIKVWHNCQVFWYCREATTPSAWPSLVKLMSCYLRSWSSRILHHGGAAREERLMSGTTWTRAERDRGCC